MKQEQVIELAVNAGFLSDGERLYAQNGFDRAYCVSEVLKLAALVEQATLERAAFECAFIAGLHGQSAKHEERNDDYQRFVGAQNAAIECADAIRNLAKEST